MSRIGKSPIKVPAQVKVQIQGSEIRVEGPKGKLDLTMNAHITAKLEGDTLTFTRKGENRQDKSLHGLTRALVANMIKGVTEGFTVKMEIHGVGFRAAVKGKELDLNVGKSHPVLYPIPADVKITVEDNTKLKIEGIDKSRVGQVAAQIRAYYPPEPYKGKGIRYAGEQILRKEGKTAQSK